jgi:hypothetical protein
VPEGELSEVLHRVFQTAIIFAGIWVLEQSPRIAVAGRLLGIAALLFSWSSLLVDADWFMVVSRVVLGIFFLMATVQLVLYLARAQSADTSTVLASVCGYIMVGLSFAIVYEILESRYPGAFVLVSPENYAQTGELLYFSFVTQTTLGFGEITPVMPLARSLTIAQAVFGQFYVAIIVARLIGLVMASHRKES